MAAPRRPYDHGLVVAYLRVSTEEQGDSGAGLDAQRAAITSEVERRGWTLVETYTDVASGKSTDKRPGLASALEDIQARRAGTLMVSKLDRLSRSLLDFAGMMANAHAKGWNLVALDLGIDLSTPAGEFMASVMASAAQWERRIIGQRTRDALAARRAAGVRLGRPRGLSDETIARIVRERQAGETFQRIAENLEHDQVPTRTPGARWHASTVRAVWVSQDGRALR